MPEKQNFLRKSLPRSRLPHSVHTSWLRWHEFVRYVISGCFNTVFTYAVYVICLRVVEYRVAYTITSACGVLMSYCLNAQFVFKKQLRLLTAFRFVLVYFVQYLVGLSLLYGLVELFGMSKLVAPILILFVVVPSNYMLNWWVIKGRGG